MSEKGRGAIFNALGDIEGLTVLDAFSGTGALSFEALSRGALRATAIDSDKAAAAIIAKNAATLGLEKVMAISCIYADSWHTRHQTERFDLVFLDPPYDDVQIETAEKLALHTATGGVAVFSLPPEARIVLPEKSFELLSHKAYGNATVTMLRKL